MSLDSKVPSGPLELKWQKHKDNIKPISPANKRKYKILVVGTGLAGGSAAATLGELGFDVEVFTYHDSARRAHSVAAQGGINAAKNYQNDGDSVWRLFIDTIKGGDYRAREANTYRLAELSGNIIDQATAQGVPFAREYGGYLDNRSFGGALVSRTFYARGQTGQQLLLGVYSGLSRQVGAGHVKLHSRQEMLDLIVIDGIARGIVVRDLANGKIESFIGDAVILATGGYANVFFLSTLALHCNATAIWRAYKKGAYFANPCFTQIHPTCIPQHGEYQSKLTLMSESLRNDGRVWVPKNPGETRPPDQIPEEDRDYFLERLYPSYGNLSPRDIASRAAKRMCDEGRGVGKSRQAVYLDFSDALNRLGRKVIDDRYGNLFEMYERIVDENPYKVPMMIYPAPHYTMGGLWVDYNLMNNIPGLFVLGEANFSDHGANRLGASALMQGLSDGYFIIPYTINAYLSNGKPPAVPLDHPEIKKAESDVKERINKLISINGKETPTSLHRKLGKVMWNYVGMGRNEQGLKFAINQIQEIRDEFWHNLKIVGNDSYVNPVIEKALRVADFMELAELIALDALERDESCGAHFREEHQTPEGEALRDDEHFAHVAAWEYNGDNKPIRHKEELNYEFVQLATRSYK
ncbi:MAG TPA: fumarate reductase/succinate dehydrogenase flavoprotein subunit [Bacteroidota bacterium]|nr:fumarate reductase/succinate dehydrogenase flavoprotein subunit [Candidatus Kapabacteria bacterium]HRS01919.1 fumarate reductase/succinate dehydrogenase flavoprotein subunit [Bacteroidota bacterium]HRT67424.1 fumarate reductase/succinate dehydrogenase flavoprotein subunit [Bacteroidota bacterium]